MQLMEKALYKLNKLLLLLLFELTLNSKKNVLSLNADTINRKLLIDTNRLEQQSTDKVGIVRLFPRLGVHGQRNRIHLHL